MSLFFGYEDSLDRIDEVEEEVKNTVGVKSMSPAKN